MIQPLLWHRGQVGGQEVNKVCVLYREAFKLLQHIDNRKQAKLTDTRCQGYILLTPLLLWVAKEYFCSTLHLNIEYEETIEQVLKMSKSLLLLSYVKNRCWPLLPFSIPLQAWEFNSSVSNWIKW